jgi:hypothetical protein
LPDSVSRSLPVQRDRNCARSSAQATMVVICVLE